MWAHGDIKLTGGPHGIPPNVIRRIQRDRLLKRMTAVVAEHGFAATTVRRIIEGSGISRRTYYGLYEDKEDCYLDAYGEITSELTRRVAAGFASKGPPEQRLRAGLGALAEFCVAEPEAACACIVEVHAAGARRVRHALRRCANWPGRWRRAFAELRAQHRDSTRSAQVALGGVFELLYEPLDRRASHLATAPFVGSEAAERSPRPGEGDRQLANGPVAVGRRDRVRSPGAKQPLALVALHRSRRAASTSSNGVSATNVAPGSSSTRRFNPWRRTCS